MTKKQKQLLAEILGNFAIALITVGVISPFFDPNSPKICLVFNL